MKFLLALVFLLPLSAESLHYSINWQSGVSLGEATLTASAGKSSFSSSLEFAAGVPGFDMRDEFHSNAATEKLCSTRFEKTISHGTHTGNELLTFDQEKNTVKRESTNKGGGSSELNVSLCARDPLAFLQFVRQELAQGRMSERNQVIYGAAYDLTLSYAGVVPIAKDGKKVDTDRVTVGLRGPASNLTFEIFFARDAGRTPLQIKLPLTLGTFTAELIR